MAGKVIRLDPYAAQAKSSLVHPDLKVQQITKDEFMEEVKKQQQEKGILPEHTITLVQGSNPMQKDAYLDYAFDQLITKKTLHKLDSCQKQSKSLGHQTSAVAALRGGAIAFTEPLEHTSVLPMAVNTMPTATAETTYEKAYVGNHPVKINPRGAHIQLDHMDDIVDTGNSVVVLIKKAIQHLIESGAEELAKTATFRIFTNYIKAGRPNKNFDKFWFPELLYDAYKQQCASEGKTPLAFDTANPELQKELNKVPATKTYQPIPDVMVRIQMFLMQDKLQEFANIRQVPEDRLQEALLYANDIISRLEIHATISNKALVDFTGADKPWTVLPNEPSGPQANIPSAQQLSNSLQAALTAEQLQEVNLILPASDLDSQGKAYTSVEAVNSFIGISNQLSDILKVRHTHSTIECTTTPKVLCQDIKGKERPGKVALLAGTQPLSAYPAEFLDFLHAHHESVVFLNISEFKKENLFYSNPAIATNPAIEVVSAKVLDHHSAVYTKSSTLYFDSQLEVFLKKAGLDL